MTAAAETTRVKALRLLFDEPFAGFSGTHYTLRHAPNNPKPVQARLPLWIGGAGEKRTLRTAACFALAAFAEQVMPEVR